MPMYNSTGKTTVIILKNIVKTVPESIYHYPKDKPIMDNDITKSRSFKVSVKKDGVRERWYKMS